MLENTLAHALHDLRIPLLLVITQKPGGLELMPCMVIINASDHFCSTDSGTTDLSMKALHRSPLGPQRTQLIFAGGLAQPSIDILTPLLKIFFFREADLFEGVEQLLSFNSLSAIVSSPRSNRSLLTTLAEYE